MEILRKLMESRTKRKIVPITEAHLSLAQHYDAEIAKYFHYYNVHRQRHKVKPRG